MPRARPLYAAFVASSVATAFVAALASAVAFSACEEPAPPRLIAPELETPPAVRSTAGAARASGACAGHSDDPPTAVLDAAVEQARAGGAAAYAELLGLAFAWPRSATVRVRAADAAREPGDAHRLYADALHLHDTGCALAPEDLHLALTGLGAARLTAGDLPGAREVYARAVAAFPDAAPTRYAYAATLCRSHEREECVRELLAALDAERDGTSLRDLAARDPDFETVRPDARLRARLTP